jgi:hypothetical protein
VHRAFIDAAREDARSYRQAVEDYFATFLPIVREARVEGDPMPVWKSWLLHWVSSNQNYADLLARGHALLKLEFSEIKRAPEQVIDKIFRYCDFSIAESKRIKEVLSRNSQEGSVLGSANEVRLVLPKPRVAQAVAELAVYGFSSTGNRK